MIDSSIFAAVISGVAAMLTVAGAVFSTVKNAKDKGERKADRTVAEETAAKIRAERESIADEASDRVIARINADLDRVKNELEDARKSLELADDRAEKYREQLIEKNDKIFAQDVLIDELKRQARIQDRAMDRLTRRARTLESWIEDNHERFEALGINGLPKDIGGDREVRSKEQKSTEEDRLATGDD